MKRKSVTEATSLLMELCSRSEKSVFEIRQKLKLWNLESKADIIIATLKKENFLNEIRFAKAFSHDKYLISKWGRIKIKYLLRGHQIPESTIEEALTHIDAELYKKMIYEELAKKNQSLNISNRFKRKARLYSFGSQRGYESELINHYFQEEGL